MSARILSIETQHGLVTIISLSEGAHRRNADLRISPLSDFEPEEGDSDLFLALIEALLPLLASTGGYITITPEGKLRVTHGLSVRSEDITTALAGVIGADRLRTAIEVGQHSARFPYPRPRGGPGIGSLFNSFLPRRWPGVR